MSSMMETLLGMIIFFGFIGIGSLIIKGLSPKDSVVWQVNVIVVIATGLVLVWYTVETRRLRIEAQKQVEITQQQKEIQQRPFVILEVGNFGRMTKSDTLFPVNREYHFRVRNIGNSPAINVKVNEVQMVPELFPGVIMKFPDTIPILLPGEPQPIRSEDWHEGKSRGGHLDAHLDPAYTNGTSTITIEFCNVEMMRYHVKLKIAPKYWGILCSGKV